MQTNFFSSTPRFTNDLVNVAEVQNKMVAFNAMYEVQDGTSSAANCKDRGENFAANWRKAVREGVINCFGSPMELDFFEKIAGGTPKKVDATDLYIKSNTDVDYNIWAEAGVEANAPGEGVWFTLGRSLHHANGKYSNIVEGGSLYIYEDNQWVYVHTVNRAVDFAHQVLVKPRKKAYQINIRTGSKMMFTPVRIVGGVSCPAPSSTWMTNGYIAKVQPLRVRKDWKIPIDLMRGYKDVMQFAIMFDENGKEVDAWDWKEKHTARLEMKWMKNLSFFLGQKIDNPELIGAVVDEKYPGYEGYDPMVRYGGGMVYPFDPSIGFDAVADLEPMMIAQESKKKAMEYIGLVGFQFGMSFDRRNNQHFKDSAGSCTFKTFERSGMSQEDIRKLRIRSWSYGNFTFHIKPFDALSDSRGIGNHDFPNRGYFMPSDWSTKDSKGNSVPAIDFYMPGGTMDGSYEEHTRDRRNIDGCEYLEGHMAETTMMAVNCVDQHIILDPVRPY